MRRYIPVPFLISLVRTPAGSNSSLMNGVGIKYYTRQLMDIALWGKACPLWVT
ncbi:MAG: hypothetical protein WAK08_24930 [Pseudolabrys sp.]|jgi:hypothetical protein